MKTRFVHLALIAVIILTNVGAAAAAPSSALRAFNGRWPPRHAEALLPVVPEIAETDNHGTGPNLAGSKSNLQLSGCTPPAWSVDGVAVSSSTEGALGRVEAYWPQENEWRLSDPRTFEGRLRARAGDTSGLSNLSCIATSNCGLEDTLSWILMFFDWLSNSKGELTRWVDLSVEGQPATKTKIHLVGDLDGLLVVSTLGVAVSTAKVTAYLSAQKGAGAWQTVMYRERPDQSVFSIGIYPTTVASGEIWRDVTLDPGQQLHLQGYLKAEATAANIPPVGFAFGVSQFLDTVGGGYLDQRDPPINIADPGLKIRATIVNVYPTLANDQSSVLAAKGEEATNTGTVCDGDSDPVSLSASIGNVVNNSDGTWTWTYLTGDGPAIQTVTITATDGKGGSTQASFLLVTDSVPPTTTLSLSGTQGKAGWYRSDVGVTLTAIDNPGGSGIAMTEYTLDGTTWLEYFGPIPVSTEGISTLSFRSIDVAGNVEPTKSQTIQIDKTPPIISGSATAPPNRYGWYKSNVVVHFSASDALSGIDKVTPDVILGEGANQSVTGIAKDKAGNQASTTVRGINIDTTKPRVLIESPQGRDYLRTERFKILWSATDNLSGIASNSGLLDQSPAVDGQDVDAFFLSLGSHAVSVTAEDKAGNIASASVSFRVVANFDTLAGATRRAYEMGWISKVGPYKALEALVKSATAAMDRGQPAVAVKLLQAYLTILEAQKGKGVNQQAYDLLRGDAEYMISHLQ